MKPVFSIITITYNAAAFLETTIQSIVGQTYPHIEYLIIDGASNDGTQEIIKRYEAEVNYWVSEPDKGLYDAMNKGLKQATGDYVWFINAGDALHAKNTVELIANQLAKKEKLPTVVYGETNIVDVDRNSLGMRRLRAPEKLTWKSFRMGMLVSHQSFLALRTVAPLYDTSYRFSADFDWCIRCMQQPGEIHHTHEVLADYLHEGLSTNNRKASLKERFRIMSKYYGYLPTLLRHFWFALRFYTARQKA